MLEPTFVTNPWFYLVAIPATLSIGISKGGLGGTGGLAVPLMSLVISVPQATGILLPLICFADLFAFWTYRRIWDRRNLRIILPGGLAGIAVGTASFRYLDPRGIKLLIGVIAIWFAVHSFAGRRRVREARGPDPLRGGFWSAVCGFTSFVAHAGAPPLSVYLVPQRLERSIYVGTLAVFYTAVNYAKVLPYAWLGQLSPQNLATSALLLPLIPVGVLAGRFIQRTMDDDVFYRVIVAILLVTGAKLCYDGIAGLLSGA